MTLFDDDVAASRPPRLRPSRSTVAGLWCLVVAAVALLVLSFLPAPYVVQRPGPIYNTLGTATTSDGTEVPLIQISGAETYPTSGALDLLTVQVVGDRTKRPSWIDLAQAWFDPSRAVVPVELIFPEGETTEQRNAANTRLMVDSQLEATAAALRHLGYGVPERLQVGAVTDGSAASGVLQMGDVIRTVDGEAVTAGGIADVVTSAGERPLELVIERDGVTSTVTVTPTLIDGTPRLGITPQRGFDFPFDVTIRLDAVGGPSAGMMFAAAIVDLLPPGAATGGAKIAGTGTIDADGTVGAIGGVRQKLYGARDAGATAFLAPAGNCGEVVGHVPDGLRVISVETLDDALTAIDVIASGAGEDALAALPTCT